MFEDSFGISRQQYAIYFAKDFLLLWCSSHFLRLQARKASVPPPFLVPLLLFVWFGVLQIFNPGSAHLVWPDGSENIFLLHPFDLYRLCAFR